MADEEKAPLKKAARLTGGKHECQVQLKGRERDYLDGHRNGAIGCQSQMTAKNGSDWKCKIGAGYDKWRRK